MSGRRRVARVIARLNVGGPARHVTWLTAALNDDAYESLLITGSLPPGEDDLSSFAREHGVEPVVIEAMSRAIHPKDLLVVAKLFRLFRRFRPDIIHTHTAKAGTVGRLAGLLYRWTTNRRVRLVHTFHGHVFHGYYGQAASALFVRIERLLARFTDAIVVISPRQLEEIHGRYGVGRREQFAVVPLGLELPERAPAIRSLREEVGIAASTFVAGIVGRLTEIKDHAFFLDGVAAWLESHPAADALFLVIGGGHLRGALEEQARRLALGDRVRFLGNRDDPDRFYPALDLLVLTSRNEGTPLTILEAFAHRVPVLASAVGGVPDLIGADERGLLYPVGDRTAFVNGLTRLYGDAVLRRALAERGRELVCERYSTARLVRDIRSLYERL